ncbi:hypothetical protein CPU12_04290 [Malaciobacter molluscorum LMG 25693]|uniref:N-acyl amino acid synthase FeeM catalytic core domain-containing protein n=1 Tax=Malaciobacter molluscorum LMG 25693 TaxID=870501 RepID=A0A2G1DJV2_9BACT|nr:hypothetical protein [Malaciobacter molluscorum]AXX92956.1 hypothetical protein AMOL_1997 [Malaciobacter molluscorum LMG 25693]PHO18785.1 hypothetical protein CPU12_04290 [Malaciobacter molluscorum LMG 25693]
MFNINKNSSVEQLQLLLKSTINKSLDYMPKSFNDEQLKAFDVFKKRIYLEEIIEKSVSFNKSLNFETENKNLYIVKNVEELVNIFKLRSEIYTRLNYNNEFPEIIEGLNFDKYDVNSAIIYNKTDKLITGTCRLIFDSEKKLPIEEKLDLDYIRDDFNAIAEVSRLTIKHQKEGLSLDFKNLTQGIYAILKQNNQDATISVISKEHFKLYSKFGGFNIEKELNSYGHLNKTFVITSWDISKISKFFQKAFLK